MWYQGCYSGLSDLSLVVTFLVYFFMYKVRSWIKRCSLQFLAFMLQLAVLLPDGSQSLKLTLSHFVSCLLPPSQRLVGHVFPQFMLREQQPVTLLDSSDTNPCASPAGFLRASLVTQDERQFQGSRWLELGAKIMAVPLTSCVAWGQLPSLSGPDFLISEVKWDNCGACLIGPF